MRIPSPYRDRRSGIELQLTPMIDCVFLLMVYFLWSSSFAVAELSLPGRISAGAGGSGGAESEIPPPEADFDKVLVRVLLTEDGPAWEVNGAPVASLAQLQRTFAQIARIKRDVPVVLHPAGDVPLGDAIDVFDLSRLAGLTKIQFAAAEGLGIRE